MPKSIKIYSRKSCSPCRMLKQYLKHKGLEYSEVDVDESPEAQEEAYRLSGYTSVPVTHITKEDNTETVIFGYNLRDLAPALAT